MSTLRWHTTIEPMGPAAALVLTDEQVAELGGGKRAAVQVRIGDRTARLRLAVMGGQNLIGLSKANRALLGVELGQEVDAEVALDEAAREITVPDDLAAALAGEPALREQFEALAFSHRRAFVEWVEEAKKPETRQRRVSGTLDLLREGKTRN